MCGKEEKEGQCGSNISHSFSSFSSFRWQQRAAVVEASQGGRLEVADAVDCLSFLLIPLTPPLPFSPSQAALLASMVTAPLLWLAITAALSPPITLKYCTKMVSCWPGQLSRSPASFSFVVVDKRTRTKACRRECRTVCACAADSV